MQIVSADHDWLSLALATLRAGGVIAHATETCYGLACDMTNPAAVAKLFTVKNRPTTQPVSALFATVEQAKEYVDWSPEAEELAKDLPGPLTLVLPLHGALFPTPAGGVTVGVRVSPHPVALALVEAFGRPVTTTSANVHGLPNPYSAEDITTQFGGRPVMPDLLIDSGILQMNPPSRVIDLSGEVRKTLR